MSSDNAGRAAQSSRRRAVALLGTAVLGVLSGCGFTPIAAPVSPSAANPEAAIRLRDIRITSDDRRFSYEVRRELDKWVVLDERAPLRLVGETTLLTQGLAIEQNDTVTRLNLRADTSYRLLGAVGEPEKAGAVRSVTAVNATTELYATEVSRAEAVDRLAQDTARRLLAILQVHNASAASSL